MKRILFVDDEPSVLTGLRRMLHRTQDRWEISFASSGQEALEVLARQPFDAVVSDMRMPEMNGVQLLNQVKALYPSAVRFILSGHSDHELIVQSVACTHQFLAKPCDSATLISSLDRSLALREFSASEELKAAITALPALPVLPELYSELIKLLSDEEASTREVADLISRDIGISTKLLHLVHSAYFGLPTTVNHLHTAVSLLGLQTVKALVLAAGVFEQFDGQSAHTDVLKSIYDHSIRVGVLARKLACKIAADKLTVDRAFFAGIVHDIGKPILLVHAGDRFLETIETSRLDPSPVPDIERACLGVSHPEVGAYLLALWGEPDTLVEAVLHHHTPSRSIAPDNLLSLLHAANSLDRFEEYESREDWERFCADVPYLHTPPIGELLNEFLADNAR